ncbi:MAG TPA: adenylate/guanylate cyclase domain-containing protein [Methylomirabilota bacterium]|jgi:class 3 adenylate cyclase|nr:adenylate/guanylate cyclase domain-containing protein [Methylomirabilota bacterium]
MAQLSAKARARLPNTAFAYVDSKGHRRLPIHDEPHVRNALARFNQIKFEDDTAREQARKRLLTAAKKHGIVPIGFITGQLATERLEGESRGRADVVRNLPTGQVTFLLSDIEDSTGLLRRLGDGYADVLNGVRRLLLRAVQRSGGREVDVRADEMFAVFKRPAGALGAALAIQRRLGSRAWPDGARVRVRIGIHTGRPTLTDNGYVGLAVHTAARICTAGHGGQILLSHPTVRATGASVPVGVSFRALGNHRLRGLPEPEALFQMEAPDLPARFPPPRTAARSFPRRPPTATPRG